ncbi:MAG: hypothetical protein MUE53_10150 [Chitinophagales bacterium]|jgi:hypothetical protein|nr:hypothetical protein [Chitinophagales bacterium]
MKKIIIPFLAISMMLASCDQKSEIPQEKIDEALTNKFGAELDNYQKMKELECEMSYNELVATKLAAAEAASASNTAKP